LDSLVVRGETPEGRLVAVGFYDLYQTHGFPLAMSLGMAFENGIVPDWMGEVEVMGRHGIKRSKAVSMIREAVLGSSIPADFAGEVLDRIEVRLGV
jgi:hypothetical protein